MTSTLSLPSSSSPPTLYIPIRDSTECVSVPLSPLPSDPHDLIDLLKLELAHPLLWLECCLQYYKKKKYSQFISILSVICGQEATEAYRQYKPVEFKSSWADVLNMFSSWETLEGMAESDEEKRKLKFSSAISHLNEAAEIDIHSVTTWCNKGFLLYFEGEIEKAEENFNNAIQSDKIKTKNDNSPRNILPIIGKALCCVALTKLNDALKCFSLCIKENEDDFPMEIRVAIGFIFYQMGKFDESGRIFETVVKLSPRNVDGLLGSYCYQMNKKNYTEAMKYLSAAYEYHPSHIGVLISLSYYYLYRGEYGRGRMMAARALDISGKMIMGKDPNHHIGKEDKNNSDSQNKSNKDNMTRNIKFHCLFLMGRSYHAEGNIDTAHSYYLQAKALISHYINTNHTNNNNTSSTKSLSPLSSSSSSSSPSSFPLSYHVLCFTLSQTHYHRKEYPEAKSLLSHISHYYPHDYHIQRRLAATCYELKLYKDAVKHYEMALNSPPIATSSTFLSSSSSTPASTTMLSPKLDCELLLEYAQALQLSVSSLSSDINSTSSSTALTSSSSSTSDRLSALTLSYQSYHSLLSLLSASRVSIPSEVYNNLSVCCHQLSKYDEAVKYYKMAIIVQSPSSLHFIEEGDENKVSEGLPLSPTDITLVYNLGLCYEAIGKGEKAKKCYKIIRLAYPNYIDATLRLAIIMNNNQNESSSNNNNNNNSNNDTLLLLKEALTHSPTHLGILSQLGSEYLSRHDYNMAAKQFLTIMKETTKGNNHHGDTYAKIALGNIQYAQGGEAAKKAQQISLMMNMNTNHHGGSGNGASAAAAASRDRAKISSNISIAAEHYERAGKYFRSVLTADPTNYLAANGMALVLISEGKYNEAREFFSAIRNGMSTFIDATINLGITHCYQQRYSEAATIFKMVIGVVKGTEGTEKGKEKEKEKVNQSQSDNIKPIDGPLLLRLQSYLAKTLYLSNHLFDSQSLLLSLTHHSPHVHSHWYNLALTMEEMAIQILQKPKHERSLQDVQLAVQQLQQAMKIFTRLGKLKEKEKGEGRDKESEKEKEKENDHHHNIHFDESDITYIYHKSLTHKEFCQMSLSAATPHLNAAKQRENELKKWREETLLARMAMEEKMREEDREREKKKEDERKRAEEVAKKAKEHLGLIQEEWIVERERERESEKERERDKENERGGKRSKEDDDFIEDDKEDQRAMGISGKEEEESDDNGNDQSDESDDDEGSVGGAEESKSKKDNPSRKAKGKEKKSKKHKKRLRKESESSKDNQKKGASVSEMFGSDDEQDNENGNGNTNGTQDNERASSSSRLQRKAFGDDEEEEEKDIDMNLHIHGNGNGKAEEEGAASQSNVKRRKIVDDDDDEEEAEAVMNIQENEEGNHQENAPQSESNETDSEMRMEMVESEKTE